MKGQRKNERRGTVIIAALVSLVVVMAMLGLLLQGTVRAHRQLHTERNARQCELLLQAGLEHSLRRMATEEKYEGETWQIPSEEIIGRGRGEITISIERSREAEIEHVHVSAEYPAGEALSIRRSQTYLSPSSKNSSLE